GQVPDSKASRLIASDFKNENGTRSTLILSNPSPTKVTGRVSFITNNGVQTPKQLELSLPGNASRTVTWDALSNSPFATARGWLFIESDLPLLGVVILDSETSRTALPLQSKPS